MPALLIRTVEAVHQTGVRQGSAEEIAIQIDDHALVGLAPVDQSLVDTVVAHKQNIPRTEKIILVLHKIADLPFDHDDQLVKIVKVKVALLPGGVSQMKIMIVFLQITCLPVLRLHQHHLFLIIAQTRRRFKPGQSCLTKTAGVL